TQWIARHDVDERADTERVRLGRLDAACGITGVRLEQSLADHGIQVIAGAYGVGEDEAERDGECGGDDEEAEGLAADAAEGAQVTESRDAQGERREDEWHDYHEQHPQEDLPDGVRDVVDDPKELRSVAPEIVRGDTCNSTDDETDEDLRMERHAAPLRLLVCHVYCSALGKRFVISPGGRRSRARRRRQGAAAVPAGRPAGGTVLRA